MVVGRHDTYEFERAMEQEKLQKKADAARATGPAKIFNDVAVAIDTLAQHVDDFWRGHGPGGFSARMHLAMMDGKFEKFREETRTCLHSETIDGDLKHLAELSKGLPWEQRKNCEYVIAATWRFVRAEQATHAREEPKGFFKPQEQKAIDDLLASYPQEYANCVLRIEYEDQVEMRRRQFERTALEMMAAQGIDVFKKPLSFAMMPRR